MPLYDFGELEGMLYIAMRMVDGGDLAGLISGGPIAPARALTMLDQVADALDTLHNRGLVHLDVKPANVLVTSKDARIDAMKGLDAGADAYLTKPAEADELVRTLDGLLQRSRKSQ